MRPPSHAALIREREEMGERVFTAGQIRQVLAEANIQLRTMILLGVNAGFGNTDIVNLATRHLDLVEGWVMLPRTKTAIRRRCPLWPETTEALVKVLQTRRKPIDPKLIQRVFINNRSGKYRARNLSRELGNAMKRAGLDRKERDFYDLRRTCASIGIQVNDDDAVRIIMGHQRSATDMLGTYNRLGVSDVRLRAVTDYIHAWVYARQEPPKTSVILDVNQPANQHTQTA